MAFDAAERNGEFGRIQCQRGKESSGRGKRKRRVFLCRRRKSKYKAKSSQRVFGKLKEGGRSLGQKTGEKETDKRIGRWSEPKS